MSLITYFKTFFPFKNLTKILKKDLMLLQLEFDSLLNYQNSVFGSQIMFVSESVSTILTQQVF